MKFRNNNAKPVVQKDQLRRRLTTDFTDDGAECIYRFERCKTINDRKRCYAPDRIRCSCRFSIGVSGTCKICSVFVVADTATPEADPRDLQIAEQSKMLAELTKENQRLRAENKQLKSESNVWKPCWRARSMPNLRRHRSSRRITVSTATSSVVRTGQSHIQTA